MARVSDLNASTARREKIALFEGLFSTLRPYLIEIEGGGYTPFFDTGRRMAFELTSGEFSSRPRAHDLRSALHRIAAAALDALDVGGLRLGRSELLAAVRTRLEDEDFDLDAARRRLDADPDWGQPFGLDVPDPDDPSQGRVPLTAERASRWTEMSVENAIWPRHHALELLNTRRLSALMALADVPPSQSLNTVSDRMLLRAAALIEPSDLDPTPAAGLFALAQAFRIPLEGRSPEALEGEIRARFADGQGLFFSEQARAAAKRLLAAPPGALAAAAQAADGWAPVVRHALDGLQKAVPAFVASFGVGAVVHFTVAGGLGASSALGAASGAAARLAGASRFLASSASFTTVLAASDGDFSARRYARDMVIFGTLGGLGKLFAARLAHVPPLLRGTAASGLTASAMTAGEVAASIARGHDPEVRAVGVRFLEHFAQVAVLHGLHGALARIEARTVGAFSEAHAQGVRLRGVLAELETLITGVQARTRGAVEALARGDAKAATRLEAEIAEALSGRDPLTKEAVELVETFQPGEGQPLLDWLRGHTSAWSAVVTPGRRPRAEVERGWRAVDGGQLGAPVPPALGIQVRANIATPRNMKDPAAWPREMERLIETLAGDLRSGRLNSFDGAFAALSRGVLEVSRISGRGDAHHISVFGRDRRDLVGFESFTPFNAHPDYGRAARFVEPLEGPFAEPLNPAGPVPRLRPMNDGWLHPDPSQVAPAFPELSQAFQRARNAGSHRELVRAVAEFQWRAFNLMPFERGSGSGFDALGRALLQAGGRDGAFALQPGRWREGVAPDLEAFTKPLERYVGEYPAMYDPVPPAELQP